MKVYGYITGFYPALSALPDARKKHIWSSDIDEISIDDTGIRFRFSLDGEYQVFLTMIKPDTFQGYFKYNGVILEKHKDFLQFDKYEGEKGIVLFGRWVEDMDYDCIIQIRFA